MFPKWRRGEPARQEAGYRAQPSPAVLMLGRELHVFNHIEASRILPLPIKRRLAWMLL
ncbi:MAG: hypothetical protein R2738_02240 [Bacteroides graminisolvens]